MKDDKHKYPMRYEIEQALSEFCKRSFVDEFAQRRGIFITKAIQNDLAKFLSGLFWEYVDLEEIRNAAFQTNTKSTLAGFLIQSEDQEFDLVGLFDRKRGCIVDERRQMHLGIIVSTPERGEETYRGSINYTQKKPGRVEFLQEDERSFDFHIHQQNQGKWEVLVDCHRSNDAKVMEEWIKKVTDRDVSVETIDQDALNSMQTVNFFDELAKRGMSEEWNFIQVKRITLRSASDEEEEEKEETEETVLSGITKAILEGNSLRNNSFVKQSEDSGYRFTAMNYEYEHKTEPYVMQVRAEFKGRPKVFEIALENYKQRTGSEEKLKDTNLSAHKEKEILSSLWAKAKEVFDELTA